MHKHLIDQGFLKYVEERRKIGKPLRSMAAMSGRGFAERMTRNW
jgi:hypothetical protein